jgi:hypothetical protein
MVRRLRGIFRNSGEAIAGFPSENARAKASIFRKKWNGVSGPKMSTRNIRAARAPMATNQANEILAMPAR